MPIQLRETPMTWVFTGDSITQAVHHTHGERSWVEHCHERIRWQLGRLGDAVINTGMSGWTAPQVLEAFEHLVGRFAPGVVSIALGTNDANVDRGISVGQSEDALRELVTRSAALGAQVAVHTPAGITESAVAQRPHLADYADAVRRVATDTGALLVDHAAHWATTYPHDHRGRTEPVAWLDDPIHPNAAGHRVMAELTFSALGLDHPEPAWV